MQQDKNSLRKNDMIIAAAKRLKHPKHTQKYIPILRETIESVFKIAAIINKKCYYYGPQGMEFLKDIIIFYRNNYGNL